jgi:hypothetical protein
MSARARVDAMRPRRPGRTRTADPRMPDQYWTRGRYLPYVAFGACGFLLFAVGFGLLRAVWVLGDRDPAAWSALLAGWSHPLYVAFHVFALLALTWFGLRFLGLFPKTQPPRIGPFARPPELFFRLVLNGAFAAVSLLVALVLGGALP